MLPVCRIPSERFSVHWLSATQSEAVGCGWGRDRTQRRLKDDQSTRAAEYAVAETVSVVRWGIFLDEMAADNRGWRRFSY